MIKEKKSESITIRMTPEEKFLLQVAAYQAGTTPSKMLRMVMDAALNAVRLEVQKGVINLEDFKALLND